MKQNPEIRNAKFETRGKASSAVSRLLRTLDSGLRTLIVFLFLLPAAALAQSLDGSLLTNEINSARARLQAEHRNLTSADLDRIANTIGVSNHLARR
jgi:hypothetical protein